MYLAFISALFSFLNLYYSHIGKPLAKWFNKVSPREKELRDKRIQLKTQQNELSMMDNFAKYSKLQRQINAIDEELKSLLSSRQLNHRDFAFQYVLKLPFALVLVFLSIYYRHTPVFILNEKFDFFPFSNIISYPNYEQNAVSLHFWVLCCTTVFKLIRN